MTTTTDYIYKRKDGGTTYCYGTLEEGSNLSLACDDEYMDGVVADIDVTEKEFNTWRKVCVYLEANYNKEIEQIETC